MLCFRWFCNLQEMCNDISLSLAILSSDMYVCATAFELQPAGLSLSNKVLLENLKLYLFIYRTIAGDSESNLKEALID